MTPKEFKRLYRIITILLEQGIDELVPARYQPWPGRLARRSLFWLKNKQRQRILALKPWPRPRRKLW